MDEAQLGELASVPVSEVMCHAEVSNRANPTPTELYQRWERQQWSAEQLVLENDRETFVNGRIPPIIRTMIENSIATFIIGEYTGLDMLGPILTGSPDEEYSVFLGTQIADETRHTRAVFRLGAEVLGYDETPRNMLAQAWNKATSAHVELSLLETEIVRDLHKQPLNYGQWLQAVTLFHLITEGVLALVGQRVLVQGLRDIDLFPGVKSAFVAMCRDESRHVGFGLHALRTGIREGYSDEIYEVLEKAVPLVMRLDNEFEGIATDFSDMSKSILRRHLKGIGADPAFVEKLLSGYNAPNGS